MARVTAVKNHGNTTRGGGDGFKQNRVIETEQTSGCLRGRKQWVREIRRDKLPVTKQMGHRAEMYSAGNAVSN